MKRLLWGVLISLSATVGGFAQSNAVIDELLSQDQALPAEVSYVVLVAAGDIAEDAGVDDALSLARQRGFFEGTAAVDLGHLSYFLMDSFQVSGGLMYTIAPGPRYAVRELAFNGLIPGRTHSDRVLTGYEALQLVEQFLHWRG